MTENEQDGDRRLRFLRRIAPLRGQAPVVFFADQRTVQRAAASEWKRIGTRFTASVEDLAAMVGVGGEVSV